MNKSQRQMKIRELINSKNISNQDEIIDHLHEIGLDVTQATVSRDIKELLLIKVSMADGTYKYSLPRDHKYNPTTRLKRLFNDVVIHIDSVNNQIIIKTLPGNAMAIGVLIDYLDMDKVLGNICGDDTVLLICRSNEIAEEVRKHFEDLIVE